MYRLYIADNPFEAHLLRGFLEANGITVQVQGDALFSMRGELPMSMDTLPSVWVLHAAEQPRAQVLLEEWQSTATSTESDWRCAQCGEQCEGTFAACWHCGSMRA